MKMEISRILCATDFSDSSKYALQFAVAIAKRHQATIELLHVMEPSAYSGERLESEEVTFTEKMYNRLRECTRDIPEEVRINLKTIAGIPYMEIIRRAKQIDADLIIIGTHGRTGIRHMLIGSVAEKIVRTAPCPVMTVRHPDHVLSDSES